MQKAPAGKFLLGFINFPVAFKSISISFELTAQPHQVPHTVRVFNTQLRMQDPPSATMPQVERMTYTLTDSDEEAQPQLTGQAPFRSPQRSHEPRSSRPRAPPKGKAPTPPIPSAYTQVAEEHYQSRSAAVSAWQAAATADGKQIVTVKQSGGNYVNLVCREAHVTPKEKRAQADKENVEGNVACEDAGEDEGVPFHTCGFRVKLTRHTPKGEVAYWAFSRGKDTCLTHVNCNGCAKPKVKELRQHSTVRYVYLTMVLPRKCMFGCSPLFFQCVQLIVGCGRCAGHVVYGSLSAPP